MSSKINHISLEYWNAKRLEYFNKLVMLENSLKKIYFFLILLSSQVKAYNSNYVDITTNDLKKNSLILYPNPAWNKEVKEFVTDDLIRFNVFKKKHFLNYINNPMDNIFESLWNKPWNLELILRNLQNSTLVKQFIKELKVLKEYEGISSSGFEKFLKLFKKIRNFLAHEISNIGNKDVIFNDFDDIYLIWKPIFGMFDWIEEISDIKTIILLKIMIISKIYIE